MKKITSLLLAVLCAMCFSLSVSAENGSDDRLFRQEVSGSSAVLYDPVNVLGSETDTVLFEHITEIAAKTDYSIGFMFTGEYSDAALSNMADMFRKYCGDDFFGMLFFTAGENKTPACMISPQRYAAMGDECLNVIQNEIAPFIENDDFYGAGITASFVLSDIIDDGYDCSSFPDEYKLPGGFIIAEVNAREQEKADEEAVGGSGEAGSEPEQETVQNAENGQYKEKISGNYAFLHDLDDTLTPAQESEIFEKLREVTKKHGFSVGILISDNIGTPKTKRQSIDYADVYYEKECGKDTDGIMLLMNNDTKDDWISTSGKCIKIFTDKKIDRLFDYFYGYLEKDNFYKAAIGFCEAVDKCASGDSYFSKTGSSQTSYYSDHVEIDVGVVLFFLIFIVILELCIVLPIFSSYKLKAVKGAGDYMIKSSLVFSVNEDKYIRTYVTHHTVSSSSGGGGGGHSSTHHSSGGGHHGGGGRHR